MISREEALQFVNEQIENKNIVKHMLATEGCMVALARELKARKREQKSDKLQLVIPSDNNINVVNPKGDERALIDEEKWGLAGLLHDADYREDVPAEKQGVAVTEMLAERGYEIPEDMAHAMAAHNSETGVAPESLMDWAIFCCDSLTGLIVATALVRPDKKLASVELKSVMKKYKVPSFASGTRREDIALCEEKLGIPLEEFVGICLTAMQGIADPLGL